MIRVISKIIGLTALAAVMLAPVSMAQDQEELDRAYFDGIKVDRYLDAEIWTNHSDNEFYEGDQIVLNFRVNRDAFVAIYSIDSRGRVNLLFPTMPDEDNFVQGGVSYRLPEGNDDYDLVVTGPEGAENIQIIASRERFPIPEWYPTSGLICDWDDRLEYMDYINGNYFLRYDGQRFAFDRTAIYINEWEDHYYRPIYYPHYPSWTTYGNVYIDYPWGATVYINGIYWGVTPLYIPRIYVGWHTFTIYDYYGSCWEYPVHITRYNTVVLDRTIVLTSPTVVSKYKDVRLVGYRDPVVSGYPSFKTKKITTASKPSGHSRAVKEVLKADKALAKKYVRGSSKLVKSDRGFETTGTPSKANIKGKAIRGPGSSKGSKSVISKQGSSSKGKSSKPSSRYKPSGSSSGGSSKAVKGSSSGKSSDYYQKKSGSSTYKKSSPSKRSKSTSGKSSKVTKSTKSSKGGSYQKSSPSSKAKSTTPKKVSSGSKSSQKSKPSSPKKSSSDSGKGKSSPKSSKKDGKSKR